MRLEYGYPILSTTIWGISIVGGKIVGNEGFAPLEITFGRFALASFIFIPILIYLAFGAKKSNIIPKKKHTWLMLFLLSLTGVAVNNTIFYFGLELTDASIASMLVSLNPLMTMLFAVILLGESFSKRKGISVLFGIIGVALIIGFSGETTGQLIGNLLILGAITIWGSSFSFSKKASEAGLSSIAITGISEIMGSVILFPIMLTNGSLGSYAQLNSNVIFWFIFMGILSSVIAYIIHYQAISILGAGKVAPSTNIIPFSGALASWLLLGEKLEGYPFIGLIFVIIGVYLVQSENPDSTKTTL